MNAVNKKPMFDLSAFDTPAIADNQVAVVLSIPVAEICEDKDQPRTEFDQEQLESLAGDILIRGVQQPISVRPANNGFYTIIQGARRYRASVLAGKETVPAIVQSDEILFDDYSQVAENTKRANLSPIDIARFIQKRKDKGETNVEIAKKLNEPKEYVTRHLSILSSPPEILAAINAKKLNSAQTIYQLNLLYEKSPKAALSLLNENENVTRQMIGATSKSLAIEDESTLENSPTESVNKSVEEISAKDQILETSRKHILREIPSENNDEADEGNEPQVETKDHETVRPLPVKTKEEVVINKSLSVDVAGVIHNIKLQLTKNPSAVALSRIEALVLTNYFGD
ncbi:ParB/RepB/Spo0J family partition protein [Polynucleobacter sp. 31A-FELB]|jgi:ParB family chromosome partitioning protein|uniref:ParB/RepB/Spo0J family partition protein n=1 Tax=Polynucleobacter sp. 31A-FELB TaxID=2689096 RepID=UPI001C0E7B29|nr:ParB/RepB/Spo0J family partition protein [Polynucleobacter sp. 31A-FELB]MBU3587414.1 ParB/RepB/Spo0J family partition protein [Polynucleobacter sp. 31A-FELB]